MKDIIQNLLLVFMVLSVAIFLVGIFGVMKVEYFYPIVEDNLINASSPNATYQGYLSFKNSYLMSDDPFIVILNYGGFTGLVWIFWVSIKSGWSSRMITLREMMLNYSIVFLLFFYLAVILMNYLINIFVNQLLLTLFSDIVNQVYTYQLLYNFFIGIFLICVFLSFIANQIRYYRSIQV